MDKDRQEAARKICASATKGPWRVEAKPMRRSVQMESEEPCGCCGFTSHHMSEWEDFESYELLHRHGPAGDRIFVPSVDTKEDAEFIAYARTALPAALDHIEAQEERIQELTNKVIYLKELSAENRNIAIAAVRAIEEQEVDHGRYGEKLRGTLIEAGYLDDEEEE